MKKNSDIAKLRLARVAAGQSGGWSERWLVRAATGQSGGWTDRRLRAATNVFYCMVLK